MGDQEYAGGKAALFEVLRRWDGALTPETRPDGQDNGRAFDEWLERCQSRGWTRKDVYDLFDDVFKNHVEEFSEQTIDELIEIETGLIGFCAPASILVFLGDPEDLGELTAHVRGNGWREGPVRRTAGGS